MSLIQTGVNEKVFSWFSGLIFFFFFSYSRIFQQIENFQSQGPKKSEMAQIKKHKFEAMESNLTFESSNVRKNQWAPPRRPERL